MSRGFTQDHLITPQVDSVLVLCCFKFTKLPTNELEIISCSQNKTKIHLLWTSGLGFLSVFL